MKVAINRKVFGSFTPSQKAIIRMIELGAPVKSPYIEHPSNDGFMVLDHQMTPPEDFDDDGWRPPYRYQIWSEPCDGFHTNPIVIQVIEEFGEEASGHNSKLKVVEIPDDVEWYISDHEGCESVHEKHRVWS